MLIPKKGGKKVYYFPDAWVIARNPSKARKEYEKWKMGTDVYVDGAGNGTVCVIIDNSEPFTIKHDVHSHNEAEYYSLIEALKRIEKKKLYRIHMDSQLVVEQMKGNYKVRAKNLKPLYNLAWQIIADRMLIVEFVWVQRDMNPAGKFLEDLKKGR